MLGNKILLEKAQDSNNEDTPKRIDHIMMISSNIRENKIVRKSLFCNN